MDKLILGEKVKVKRKKGEDGYRTFSIRVREEIVDTIARETGRTRNELIGIFLKFAADNCIIEKKEEKP